MRTALAALVIAAASGLAAPAAADPPTPYPGLPAGVACAELGGGLGGAGRCKCPDGFTVGREAPDGTLTVYSRTPADGCNRHVPGAGHHHRRRPPSPA